MRTSKHGTPKERRDKLVRAGVSCFARKGFYDSTFEDIIGESGFSRGSLYWRFESKDQLYDAVVEYSIAQIDASLAAGPDSLAGDGPLMERLFRDLARDLRQHDDFYRLLYLAPAPARARESVRRLTARFLDYTSQIVAEAVTRGELDAGLAEVLPDVIHALIEGMILRRLYDPGFNLDRFVANASRLVAGAATSAVAAPGRPPGEQPTSPERPRREK